MRITCPNCTAHFEIPSELLGRKGRSLKCANCGHSWYQTSQVETLDLAEIMGEEYAARARAEMGSAGATASALTPPPGQAQPPGRPPVPGQQQAAPLQQRPTGAPPGAPPGSAQSWYNPQPAAPPPNAGAQQASWYQPQVTKPMPPPPPGAPAWYQQTPPPGAQQGQPGAANWYQGQPPPGSMPGQPGAANWQQNAAAAAQQQGPGAPSWYQPEQMPAPYGPAGQQNVQAGPGQRPGAGYPQQPGVAALSGNSMVGQAGAGPGPGAGSVSWMQQQPGAYAPPPNVGGNVMNYAAQQQRGPMAAQMSGQSMVGQAGAAAVGDGSVSWMQQQRQPMPPGVLPGAMPGMPGASMMGQAGAGAVGDGSVSWMQQQPGAQMPGMPPQSMQHPGMPSAPGMPGVSQMGQQIAAPGQAARSMLDGTVQAPGAPGVSQMGQQAAAPGQAARSMLDGTIQAPGAPGVSQMGQEVAAPGDPARSMLDGSIQAGGQPGQSMMQDAAGAGQPGQSMMHDAAAAGQPGQSMMQDAAGAGQPGQSMMQEAAAGGAAAEAAQDAAANGAATDAKADAAAEKQGPLWSGASEDEELVDPNADRPDFGGTAEAAEATEADADENEEEAKEKKSLAAMAGKPVTPYERKKPIDPAYITASLMLVALLVAGGMLWSQRVALSRMWPGFAALYEKAGLAPKNPGDGLRLAQSGMRLQRINGVETLVVKGYISNIGKSTRNLPGLRLQLIDATNTVVQETKSGPPAASLAQGGSVDFEIRLELPDMAKAKNVIVAWDG